MPDFRLENLPENSERFWASEQRKADKKQLLCLCPEKAETLINALEQGGDKDLCNRYSDELRAMAEEAVTGVQKAAALLKAVGQNTDALEKMLLELGYLRDRMAAPWIDSGDVTKAVQSLGVCPGEILLVHSSYTALGHVIGGAQAVVDGLEAAVGKDGTLVMPTLSQKNFENAYRDWTIDRPSDVGYLTEYFRKLPGTERSDQATHSVAARGRLAKELTKDHGAFGPRLCLFGETAFAHSSPWQKMYDIGGKVVLLGCACIYNTFKHLIECMQVEARLEAVKDPELRQSLKDGLWEYGDFLRVIAGERTKVWPMFSMVSFTEEMEKRGYVRRTTLGNAGLICFDIRELVEKGTEVLEEDMARYYSEDAVKWFRRADSLAGK